MKDLLTFNFGCTGTGSENGPSTPSTVVRPAWAGGLTEIVEMLHHARTVATFFVCRHIATRHPDVIRALAENGHEIGLLECKHLHRPPAPQANGRSKANVFTELHLSEYRHVVEDACGMAIRGHRDRFYSLERDAGAVWTAFGKGGIAYDSSVLPLAVTKQGIPVLPRFPFRAVTGPHRIIEWPVLLVRLFGRWFPAAGSYLDRLPFWTIHHAIHASHLHGWPAVLAIDLSPVPGFAEDSRRALLLGQFLRDLQFETMDQATQDIDPDSLTTLRVGEPDVECGGSPPQ